MQKRWKTETDLLAAIRERASSGRTVALSPQTALTLCDRLSGKLAPIERLPRALSFTVESCDPKTGQCVDLLAAVSTFPLAKIAFDTAAEQSPSAWLILRQGARVIIDTNETPPPPIAANVVRL